MMSTLEAYDGTLVLVQEKSPGSGSAVKQGDVSGCFNLCAAPVLI